MGIFGFNKGAIGIDAGSENMRVVKNGELVFNEPSIVSLDYEKNICTGVGNEIVKKDSIIKPVDYVIKDFIAFEHLLRNAYKRISGPTIFKSLEVFFSIPAGSSEIEKRAYMDAGEH